MHRVFRNYFFITLTVCLYACANHPSVQEITSSSKASDCNKWIQTGTTGDAVSQFNSGICYENGELGNRDYVKAAEWYRRAAQQGYMYAETNLGYLYHHGLGVPQDFDQARFWYEKAAAQGENNAEDDLGLFYEYGLSVPHDYSIAAMYYQKAAEQQNVDAEEHLAFLYEHGFGVTQDYDKALHWYYAAADAGSAEAQYRIASMYKSGEGVAQNYSYAIEWMRMAAVHGDFVAQQQLTKLYRTPGAIQIAKGETILDWAQAGAMKDSPDLEDFMGKIFEFGWYAKVDKKKAILWYTKAADHGYAQGEFDLGNAYSFDNLTTINYLVAMKWFRLAADQGYAPAANNIGIMYQYGKGVPINVAKAASWYRRAAPEILAPECNLLELHLLGELAADPEEIKTWEQNAGEKAWCQNSIAWDLSTSAVPGQLQPEKALPLIKLAVEKDSENWTYLDTLATVHAALGDFQHAVAEENQAILFAQKTGSGASDEDLSGLRKRLYLYNSGKVYIENSNK